MPPRPPRSPRVSSPPLWRWALAALTFSCLGACDPFHTEFEALEPAQTYRAREPGAPSTPGASLKVMSWNIKFGGGRIDFFFDCHGDRVLMERSEVIANLEGLADAIRRVEPDVLLLQEVDVNSKRSAHIDQLQYLLDHTHLEHGVYASAWKADFIPSDGLGPMDSGNAILSRWPLVDAERIQLPLRSDQSGLTRYFYLRRNMLRARIELPTGEEVEVLNIHTTAYGTDGTKAEQIARFAAELERIAATGALVIAGGDLNTIPPGSVQTSDYPDSV
ncbi:MAG: endonuclease/exonuclease/phosphatase family protein, partial [Myxococcales bacterium]|nr:endonuclease/exonuclease/phosphatase family protein [Myxococcales bacterium]